MNVREIATTNNTKKIQFSIKDILQVGILLILLFLLFDYITFFGPYTDMPTHSKFSRAISTGLHSYPGNFILYGLINILTYCSSVILPFLDFNDPVVMSKHCLCFLLAIATTLKFRLVYNHLPENAFEWKKIFVSLSLLLVVAIPIPSLFITGSWYLGNFTPNVWHNSTTIFLFPFAILLFHLSIKQLGEYSNRRDLWLIFLVLINIFIKPSYFFVWVSVYPVLLLLENGLSLKFIKKLFPVIIGIAMLIIQYIYIYHTESIYSKSVITIKLFKGYSCFAPPEMIPWAFLFSLLYPILYFVLNFKRLRKNIFFKFAFSSLFISIAIFLLFTEAKHRTCHGNFFWQVIICSWLCFYVSILDWFKNKSKLVQQNNKITYYLCNSIYMIHVIFGVVYLGRCMFISFK